MRVPDRAFRLLPCLVLLSVVCVAAVPAGGASEAVLSLEPATVDAAQLVGDGWGEPAEVDGRKVRSITSGETAAIQGSAWWPEGLRPAEGNYWIAEIEYKDVAKQPIRFDVWAGLSTHGGRSEMHRFGGLGDGTWKTAEVPLPWDMLMVRLGTRQVEFSLRSPDGDVPVAAIRVLPLRAEQLGGVAARYNAETRNWVERVQKRHAGAKRQEMEEPQKPAESVVKSKRAIVPFVRNYLNTVYPYSAPQEGEAGKPLEARMARNEYEPVAFGVYANGQELTNVTVRVEPLKHQSGEATLSAEVRTASWSLVKNGDGLAAFPQRLWPMYPTGIDKGASGWFWVTFKSDPKSTPAGLYKGKAVVAADQGRAEVPIEVRVLPITLVDMNETDLRMGGCITGMVSRHDLDEMLKHNHNQLQYWFSGVQPGFVVKDNGDFDLDFTLLDEQFEQARKAGMLSNVYFLGGNPYGFPNTQTLPRELARQVLGMTLEQYTEMMWKDPHQFPEVLVPLYKKWVAKVMAHAKEKNWPEQILTPFDEPDKWRQRRDGTGPWIRPQFETCCKLIHEAWPATRVYGSMHHAPALLMLPSVDIFCTNAIGEDPLLGDKVRAGGKTFWQYSGMGVSAPAQRARYTFGFYFHSFNSRGSLCWAYNWFDDKWDNTEGNNWGYAWSTPLDVIPSAYYEALREAWDDRRYIETLRKVGKEKGVDVEPLLDEVGRIARESRGKGGEDMVYDFWDQAKRLELMDELRDRLAGRIVEISAKPAATQPVRAGR